MGKTRRSKASSFIEVEGKFITKPVDTANHFNNYFKYKVDQKSDDAKGWRAARCHNKEIYHV